MHIEVSGKFWNCDCLDPKLRCIPVEWPFCPNCGKKQPERLPEAGDWVWVKAQVEEYERRIANQAKLLAERANECDDLRKTYAQVMARNAEIVTDYHKFDAYLSRIADAIGERCDLSVMMMAIRDVLKEWKGIL
jgi:hypothetical protein